MKIEYSHMRQMLHATVHYKGPLKAGKEKNMATIALGPTVGAFIGLLLSLIALPLGINEAEWLMAVGAALGLFIGLMMNENKNEPHSTEDSRHERAEEHKH
jgi:hypothetical protein